LVGATINSCSNHGTDSVKADVCGGIHVININYQSGADRNTLTKKIQKITEEMEKKYLYNLEDKNKRERGVYQTKTKRIRNFQTGNFIPETTERQILKVTRQRHINLLPPCTRIIINVITFCRLR